MIDTDVSVSGTRGILDAALLLLATGMISGCGTVSTTYLSYVEPTREPPAAQQLVIDEPLDAARAQLVAGLEKGPLELETVDPQGRYVVARYTGDPMPYVDCGLLVEVPRGPGPHISEATPAALSERRLTTEGDTFSRRLRLDGRIVATLEPDPEGTVIRPKATYVLSKIVQREGSDAWGSETIAFPSGESAAFSRDVTCQPTGRLEAAAFAAVESGAVAAAEARAAEPQPPAEEAPAPATEEPPAPDTDVAAVSPVARIVIEPVAIETLAAPPPPPSIPDPDLTARVALAVPEGSCGAVAVERVPGDSVILEGIVSDLFTMDSMLNVVDFAYPNARMENRIRVLSTGACRAYRLVQADLPKGAADARLQVVNLEDGVLEQGETVQLALGLPEHRSHIHVSYFHGDETVSHYELETPFPVEPDVPWLIDTRQAVEPPYGQDLILAVATDQPLFPEPRAVTEPAAEFIPALEQALAGSADGTAIPVCAVVTTVEDAAAANDIDPSAPGPCDPPGAPEPVADAAAAG